MVWGGGVGTRIRYTHCISTLCRLSTLPQYYKPPPHHRGGESFTTTPHGGGGGDRPTLHHIYTHLLIKEAVYQAMSVSPSTCLPTFVAPHLAFGHPGGARRCDAAKARGPWSKAAARLGAEIQWKQVGFG